MFGTGSTSLKYFKRLKTYKNSTGTVEYDPETKQGRSYRWTFLATVEGQLVFNDYNWSTTTSCHQSAVRSLLRELGLKPIIGNFGRVDVREINHKATEDLYKEMFELQIESESTKRPNSWTNKYRLTRISEIEQNIAKLESLAPRFTITAKRKQELLEEAEEAELNRISELEAEKCFKFCSMKEAATNLKPIEL